MSNVKVLVLLGSLRAESVNRQIAELAAETAPAGVTRALFDRLGELPFYNEDIDSDDARTRSGATRAAAEADAALVVTPEYNGSIPGRAEERDRLAVAALRQRRAPGKPVAVIGAAHGRYGGCGRTTRPVSPSASPDRE